MRGGRAGEDPATAAARGPGAWPGSRTPTSSPCTTSAPSGRRSVSSRWSSSPGVTLPAWLASSRRDLAARSSTCSSGRRGPRGRARRRARAPRLQARQRAGRRRRPRARPRLRPRPRAAEVEPDAAPGDSLGPSMRRSSRSPRSLDDRRRHAARHARRTWRPSSSAARRVDARTDQFSFCVALYEALYGAAPVRRRRPRDPDRERVGRPPARPTPRLPRARAHRPGPASRPLARARRPLPRHARAARRARAEAQRLALAGARRRRRGRHPRRCGHLVARRR